MLNALVASSSEDIRLEERLAKIGRGGTSAAASNEFLLVLSGEPAIIELGTGDC
jgi:hypothetical protein